MKKLSIINKLIYIINTLLATCLLLSYLLPFISPKNFSSFAILSLLVPILIVINIAFVVYWIINLKKQFILSTLILIIGYFVTTPLYKIAEPNSSLNDDLKVMSYNVRMFNYWKWIDDDNILKKIQTLVTEQSPDVLLVQECYDFSNFSYPYQFVNPTKHNKKVGLSIYSKFPIINKGSLDFESTSNNVIFVDILKKKDTIRLYNAHLQSLGLKPQKENFGQEDSEKIITSLRKGFKKQAEQTNILLKHQEQWKGKVLIGGDFNNTAYSWVYNRIAKNKKDAFIEAGKGFGKTFDYWFPMRIDFILTDKNAVINQFNSFSEKYSDHFPILARINWQN